MGNFWRTWHKEIVRGAVLFCCVLAVGLFAHFLVARVRARVATDLPAALRDLRDQLGTDVSTGPRTVAERWAYGVKLAPKQWVWVHNTTGSIRVEPAKGDSLQVTAVKTYNRSDPAAVRVVSVPYEGGVAICVVRAASDTHCGPGDDVKLASGGRGDVAVDFTVRLPRGVSLGATTVTGGVHVAGASAPVHAFTVSGDVDIETAAGPVQAKSVNGSVRARIRAFGDTGGVDLAAVNGSVTAELPAHLDATVEANTVNGSIHTDYPLPVTSKFMHHQLSGTLGAGGRAVKIITVNGSIHLKKVS